MSASGAVDSSSTQAEMAETITRISSHKGVEGVIIMDRRGACGWRLRIGDMV